MERAVVGVVEDALRRSRARAARARAARRATRADGRRRAPCRGHDLGHEAPGEGVVLRRDAACARMIDVLRAAEPDQARQPLGSAGARESSRARPPAAPSCDVVRCRRGSRTRARARARRRRQKPRQLARTTGFGQRSGAATFRASCERCSGLLLEEAGDVAPGRERLPPGAGQDDRRARSRRLPSSAKSRRELLARRPSRRGSTSPGTSSVIVATPRASSRSTRKPSYVGHIVLLLSRSMRRRILPDELFGSSSRMRYSRGRLNARASRRRGRGASSSSPVAPG